MNATKSKVSKVSKKLEFDSMPQDERDTLLSILVTDSQDDTVDVTRVLMPRQMRSMVQTAAHEAVRGTLYELQELFTQLRTCKADPAFDDLHKDLERAMSLLDSIVLLERFEQGKFDLDNRGRAMWASVLLRTAQDAEALGVSWAQVPSSRVGIAVAV
jgi:hypothetical protein